MSWLITHPNIRLDFVIDQLFLEVLSDQYHQMHQCILAFVCPT